MISSFMKLPSLRSRKNSDASETGAASICGHNTTKQTKTPTGTPLFKRHFTRTSDVGSCPTIASLRSGSAAYMCDQLMTGDKSHGASGIAATHQPINDINPSIDVGSTLLLDNQNPDYASHNSLCVMTKVTNVTVERVNGSLGITLRGGAQDDPDFSRPLVITNVRQQGPAFRTGLIKVGDRLLKVDNHSLANKSLLEAQQILTQQIDHVQGPCATFTTLTIEYDISIMESVKYATGPLLVEIERHLNENLGIILNNGNAMGDQESAASIFIEDILPASIADRCGALHVGDKILAVNEMYIENSSISPGDLMRFLQNSAYPETVTRLQILPYHAIKNPHHRSVSGVWNHSTRGPIPNSPSLSGMSTINSRRSCQANRRCWRQKFVKKTSENSEGVQQNYCGYNPQLGVCHMESLNAVLYSDGEEYGLSVEVEESTDKKQSVIVISDIANDSVADRCGCLQVGDRLLSVNRETNFTINDVRTLLQQPFTSNTACKLDLEVEFDVADTVVPSSGIFTVKLSRHSTGLGITITASKNNLDEPFIISDIKRGSIAHRIGTIQTGDRLLAIDNQPLNHTTLEAAFDILTNSPNDIVTLRIEKVPVISNEPTPYLYSDRVVYTVELVRYGGPLGITISGSEDCVEPIILSRLITGGLAEKTGALHVGDRILAINGENLHNRPLSDAIRLLQCSGDRVQLKISRYVRDQLSLNSCEESRGNYPSPGLQSNDSAVESWTGSTFLETNPKNEQNLTQNEDIASIAPTEAPSLTSERTTDTKDPFETIQETATANSSTLNLQYYSDTDDVFCPSPLPLPNYSFTNSLQTKFDHFSLNLGPVYSAQSKSTKKRTVGNFTRPDEEVLKTPDSASKSLKGRPHFFYNEPEANTNVPTDDIYHVILYKDAVYDDYGFSVSDGLYEKGVFINRIRKGGPADIVGLLRPYDRILKVNDTKTQDFDCCLTVPLIASAGDRIELLIARNPNIDAKKLQILSWITDEQETCNMGPGYDDMAIGHSTITKTL